MKATVLGCLFRQRNGTDSVPIFKLPRIPSLDWQYNLAEKKSNNWVERLHGSLQLAFREMDNTGNKVDRKTCIMDLPLLVLAKVFKKLPSKDRETIMKVCQQWEDIINFEVGLTFFIGEINYSIPGHKSERWRPLGLIETVGIERCVFGELNNPDSDYLPSFMVPELVKDVSFMGEISDKHFRSIMRPVHWINVLKIHLAALLHLCLTNFSLKLCSLTQLKIFYTHPMYHLSCPFTIGTSSGRESVHGNLVGLLKSSHFCRIKIFEYAGPYFVEKTEDFTDAVRAFTQRHENSLKELVLSFPYEWNLTPVELKVHEETRIGRSAQLNSEKGKLCLSWGNVQLNRLLIVCPNTAVPPLMTSGTEVREKSVTSAWSERKLNSVWKSLLSNQLNLESLQYINKHENWDFPQFIFSNSSCHLTVISLSVNSEKIVDCRTIGECKNLSKLTLEGNCFQNDGREIESGINNEELFPEENTKIGLLNTHHLPPSLEEICFSKLMISSREMNVIANVKEPKCLPKLKNLQLYQVCKGVHHYGLTPGAVQNLFDQNNLSFSVWQALDQATFQEAIEKSTQEICHVEVDVLKKMLNCCDAESDIFDNFEFETLNDCHFRLSR